MTAVKAMMVWNSSHGDFAGATAGDLIRIEPSLSQAPGLDVVSTADTFTVRVESASGPGARFSIEHTGTGDVRDCTHAGHGSCRTDLDAGGNRW